MKKLILMFFLIVISIEYSFAQLTLPYVFENNSRYSDDEIYIGLVGKTPELGDVWMNTSTSEINAMSADANTIPGPDFSFPQEWLYPEIFTKLSDLKDGAIQIPFGLFACRIFISFESPMYLHFHETGGYAGANLNNPGDPNDGIRWEIVELTWGSSGLFTNTSRVDAYQYPMALEVDGYTGGVTGETYEASYNDAIAGGAVAQFKRIGELLSHEEILAAWDNAVSDPYKVAKVVKDNSIDGEPIIEQPSKIEEFQDDILDDYIDEIWDTYKNYDLNINIGDRGTWVGQVQADDTFLFTDPSDGSIATIHGRPTTIDAMEGSGFLAYTPTLASEDVETYNEDLLIQAQIAAAITRHAIYTDVIDGTVQFTHDADRFFVIEPYNEYVEFFHSESISFESQTYAFAYDDVGDHSSTIQSTFPTEAKVIIGGYDGYDLSVATSSNFIPDADKTYYIDSPIHDLRLAATGDSEDAYTTTTSTTGDDVTWQFVDKGNGYWHIQRAAGGTLPRLRTDNSEDADMQGTAWSGSYTYYEFEQGYTTGSYFVTLPDAPASYNRLQVNSLGEVKMVSKSSDQTWESFTFTEVTTAYTPVVVVDTPTDLFIEAEDFTDMSGVQLETTIDTNGGQNVGYIDAGDWMEYVVTIPETGTYTFDSRVASIPGNGILQIQVDGEVLGTINIDATGGWQSWTTLTTSVNLSAGTQTIRVLAVNGGWNINWLEITNESSAKNGVSKVNLIKEATLSPNPVFNELNISLLNYNEATAIDIINIKGQTVVRNTAIEGTSLNIDTSSLSNGIYLVRIKSSDDRIIGVKKLIK